MALVDLPGKAVDEIITALDMRINHIETGTTFYSAKDAEQFNLSLNKNNPTDQKRMIKVNALSSEQRKLIDYLEGYRIILLESKMKGRKG